MLPESLLARYIRLGSLDLELPDGKIRTFGSGGPHAYWRIRKPGTLRRIAADPDFMLGQAYMDEEWDTPQGGLLPLLELLIRNFSSMPTVGRSRQLLLDLLKPLQQWNRHRASRRNVAHHYDLDEDLFRRFLDGDMQYSCAYFAHENMDIDAAQRAKVEHIRRKLCLRPGQRVLDIGCGWGGLAIYLAEQDGAHVTGLTLSKEQHRVARQRVAERGLERQVDIRLEDYRDHNGRYDRVVSVGMFEHVGVPNYQTYFDCVREFLADEGVALIHTIGRYSPPGVTNAWIRRYIFPGGYVPAMSEVMHRVERSGLVTADVEVLRTHYAKTLLAWFDRFQKVREEFAERKGERFCRMWEFYLASCAMSFVHWDLVVFQFQLSRSLTAVPVTRDYLYAQPISVARESQSPTVVIGGVNKR